MATIENIFKPTSVSDPYNVRAATVVDGAGPFPAIPATIRVNSNTPIMNNLSLFGCLAALLST